MLTSEMCTAPKNRARMARLMNDYLKVTKEKLFPSNSDLFMNNDRYTYNDTKLKEVLKVYSIRHQYITQHKPIQTILPFLFINFNLQVV